VETDEERKARILKEMEEYQKNDNARVYWCDRWHWEVLWKIY
jgi:hypothetical protein